MLLYKQRNVVLDTDTIINDILQRYFVSRKIPLGNPYLSAVNSIITFFKKQTRLKETEY